MRHRCKPIGGSKIDDLGLEDLQEVVAGRGVERLEAAVVEDEEIEVAECA